MLGPDQTRGALTGDLTRKFSNHDDLLLNAIAMRLSTAKHDCFWTNIENWFDPRTTAVGIEKSMPELTVFHVKQPLGHENSLKGLRELQRSFIGLLEFCRNAKHEEVIGLLSAQRGLALIEKFWEHVL